MGKWKGVLWAGTGVGVDERETDGGRESAMLGAPKMAAGRNETSSFVSSVIVGSRCTRLMKRDRNRGASSGAVGIGIAGSGPAQGNGGCDGSSKRGFSPLLSSSVSFSSSVSSTATPPPGACRVRDLQAEHSADHSKRMMRTKYIRLRMLSGPAFGRRLGSAEDRDGRLEDDLDGRREEDAEGVDDEDAGDSAGTERAEDGLGRAWTSAGDEKDRFSAQADDDGSCVSSGTRKDLEDQVLTRLRAVSLPSSALPSAGADSAVGVEGGEWGKERTSSCRER